MRHEKDEPVVQQTWLGGLVSRWRLRRAARVGREPRVLGCVRIWGPGRVTIGDRVVADGRSCPIELHACPGATITIGDDVVIEAGVSIEAQQTVTIGDRCLLGRFCKIIDNNFHPLRGNRHERPASVPVVVEPEATLGPMCVLLPGAAVARGFVVGAGQVVSRPVGAASRREP